MGVAIFPYPFSGARGVPARIDPCAAIGGQVCPRPHGLANPPAKWRGGLFLWAFPQFPEKSPRRVTVADGPNALRLSALA
jgi:hypothetical protein